MMTLTNWVCTVYAVLFIVVIVAAELTRKKVR